MEDVEIRNETQMESEVVALNMKNVNRNNLKPSCEIRLSSFGTGKTIHVEPVSGESETVVFFEKWMKNAITGNNDELCAYFHLPSDPNGEPEIRVSHYGELIARIIILTPEGNL